MPRGLAMRMPKIPFSGKSLPGGPPTLNTCGIATKMKYDVRIVKGDESRSLSVFFKADLTATALFQQTTKWTPPSFEASGGPDWIIWIFPFCDNQIGLFIAPKWVGLTAPGDRHRNPSHVVKTLQLSAKVILFSSRIAQRQQELRVGAP
jgi:hypothetical protein